MISLLLNVLWLVFGGIWMAAGWLLAALIMAITIVGIPFAVAALRIAQYTLLPFGYTNVPADRGGRPETIGTREESCCRAISVMPITFGGSLKRLSLGLSSAESTIR